MLYCWTTVCFYPDLVQCAPFMDGRLNNSQRAYGSSFFHLWINPLFPTLSHVVSPYGAHQNHSLDLMLDPANGLDLMCVCLGAIFIEVSVFSFTPVPLKDVLVSTVTRVLVSHPAVKGLTWSKFLA